MLGVGGPAVRTFDFVRRLEELATCDFMNLGHGLAAGLAVACFQLESCVRHSLVRQHALSHLRILRELSLQLEELAGLAAIISASASSPISR